MYMTTVASHVYRGQIIGRNCSPSGVRWECYCNGTFIYADTLAGMKRLITETLKAE